MTTAITPGTDRLTRLRGLAASTSDYGRERIRCLLEAESSRSCPRFAGLSNDCGERVIVTADSESDVAAQLAELVTSDPPQSAEALVDLDTGEQRLAFIRVSVGFIGGQASPEPTPQDLARAALENLTSAAGHCNEQARGQLAQAKREVLALLHHADPAAAAAIQREEH